MDALPQVATSLSEASDTRGAVAFTALPDSGYYVLAHEHGRLIADFGGPGASPNPGHQHAGIFSFEVSLRGRRVVVDGGTSSYQADQERQQLRGTAAHNTVRVDGEDQYEVWKAFRVGRRAQVGTVRYESGDDYAWISASHDGYQRLGVEHRRAIAALGGAGWVVIDWFRGRGRHRIERFLHLHPEVEIEPSERGAYLRQSGYSAVDLTGGCFEMHDDWYSPRLGQRIRSRTLVRSEEVTLETGGCPVVWAYGLLESLASGASSSLADATVLEISTSGVSSTIAAKTNGLLRITRNRA